MHPGRDDHERQLEQLRPSLVDALLPLALEETWHPVRTLGISPDLPEDWWTTVTGVFGLEPLADGSVRIPEMLSVVLRSRLAARRPRLYREVMQQRASALLASDQVREGFLLFLDIGEVGRANELLDEWIGEKFNRGEQGLIHAVVMTLPFEQLTPRTRAAYWHSQVTAERQTALETRRAAQLAYDGGERNPRLLHALSYGYQLDGQFDAALQLTEWGLAQRPTGRDRLRLLHQHSMNLSYLKRDEEHLQAALELVEEATVQGNFRFLGMGHSAAGYAHEALGRIELAERHYVEAIRIYERTSQWRLLSVLLNNYAQTLTDIGRPAEALQRIRQAEGLPETSLRHQAWLSNSASIIHHQYGMHAEALHSLPVAADLLEQAHLIGDLGLTLLLQAERTVLDGQLERSLSAQRRAQLLLSDNVSYRAQLSFTAGVLAFAAQEWETAGQQFQDALTAELTAWDAARAQVYLLSLSLRAGRMPDPAALDAALRRVGTDAPLLTDAPLMREALNWLTDQPDWQPRLERVFELPSLSGSVPVRLELFGDIEVSGPDGPLRFALRRSAELFAFLALHGPATRQEIIAALWEGPSDRRVVDLFKKTLRGLRETLHPLLPGVADPVEREKGRYRLHPLLAVRTPWLAGALFPAPAVRTGGPLEVRGVFLDSARGPWADDVRTAVHDQLYQELLQRQRDGDPSVQTPLKKLRTLV